MMTEIRFLSRKRASAYLCERGLNRTASTLAKYATIGGGPKFRKFGKAQVVYDVADLDEWIEKQLSKAVASTSEKP